MMDRLKLDEDRIEGIATAVEEIRALEDPVGHELDRFKGENDLDILKVRVPIGVIAMIYESRPNVTVDAAALAFKSGNACVLKGGSEAIHSNTALAKVIQEAFEKTNVPTAAVEFFCRFTGPRARCRCCVRRRRTVKSVDSTWW